MKTTQIAIGKEKFDLTNKEIIELLNSLFANKGYALLDQYFAQDTVADVVKIEIYEINNDGSKSLNHDYTKG